jgi:hypothetical protein
MTFISMLHCPNSFYSQHVSGPLPLVLVIRRLGRSFPTANRLPFSSRTRLHLPASQQRKHQIEKNQGTHCLPPSRLLLLLHLNSAGLGWTLALLFTPHSTSPGSRVPCLHLTNWPSVLARIFNPWHLLQLPAVQNLKCHLCYCQPLPTTFASFTGPTIPCLSSYPQNSSQLFFYSTQELRTQFILLECPRLILPFLYLEGI